MTRVLLLLAALAACRRCPEPTIPTRPITPPPVITVAPPLPCVLPPLPAPVQIVGFDRAAVQALVTERALLIARLRAAELCLAVGGAQ